MKSAEQQRSEQAALLVGNLSGQLGRRYYPDAVSLDRFQVYHEDQKRVLQALKDFNVDEAVANGRGVIFLGTVGTGKDHLLAWLLYRAAHRLCCLCRWLSGQDFYGELRDRMDSGKLEEDRFRELMKPDVLAISDPIPPMGVPTPWNVGQLYRLLDRRYRERKSTWVSMNAISEDDADEKLSSPTWDRLREGALILKCFWPSYREKGGIAEMVRRQS